MEGTHNLNVHTDDDDDDDEHSDAQINQLEFSSLLIHFNATVICTE